MEKPTPGGPSKYKTLYFLFQENSGLGVKKGLFPVNIKGPFSYTSPNKLEQPGPPFNYF